MAEAARKAEAERIAAYKAKMDPEKMAAMKQQQELQARMQHAYKTGDTKEVEKIQRLLVPDDPRNVAAGLAPRPTLKK